MNEHCAEFGMLSAIACDHAMNPRNNGPLDRFDGNARITGPCGDTMEFWIVVQDGLVQAVSFITDGCGTSHACGSMATCLAEGKRIEEAASLQQEDILKALNDLPADSRHCALLAANTLKAACMDYVNSRRKKMKDHQSTCDSCGDTSCSASKQKHGESPEEFEDRRKLESRLCRIRHKVVVLSGKGGVGKSTVAVNIATALMMAGKRVGLLDVDIHGPSVPTMLGLEGQTIIGGDDGLLPIEVGNLKVMSLGFLLQNPDDAVIWRGPMKMGVIKQFLKDVAWGDLDYLIIDSPPGTGDEPLSVCQLIGSLDGAVVVTTPQKVASVDVRKSIMFCRQLGVTVLGVVENMSGFVCPKCGEVTQILPTGGGQGIAESMQVPFLGAIPLDPAIAQAGDSGQAFVHHFAASSTAATMRDIIQPIMDLDAPAEEWENESNTTEKQEEKIMRIAIPLADGKLCMHFGHCERFALVDVDEANKTILKREDIVPPPHEPGLLAPWLAVRGATTIIAGGMGQRAQGLFNGQGIQEVVGAPAESPETLVTHYLAGTLQTGVNTCDH